MLSELFYVHVAIVDNCKKKLNLCSCICFKDDFSLFSHLKACSAHSVLTPCKVGSEGWYLHAGLSGGIQHGSVCLPT